MNVGRVIPTFDESVNKLHKDEEREPEDQGLDEEDTGQEERQDKSPKHEKKDETESEVEWVFRLSLAVM